MKQKTLFPVLIFQLLFIVSMSAQEGYKSDVLKYGDYVYKESIKSLTLSPAANVMSMPVITLGGRGQLWLQFDELADNQRTFRFTFIHCDAAWHPTEGLQLQEYLDGFFEDQIYDYIFSSNTIQPYVHYSTLFPTDRMRPKLSGNYLLVAYEDGFADDPFFSLRFMVLEPKVSIVEANAIRDQRPGSHLEMQRVVFGINTEGYSIPFPERDLKVLLRQNERWDNAKYVKPLNIRGSILGYAHYNDENVFDGINEYRYFDTKTLQTNTLNVGKIDRGYEGAYYVFLLTDVPRRRNYEAASDINGKFFIKTDDYPDSDVEAEYAWVSFFFKTDIPVQNGSVHVVANFTQNRLDESSKMTYNYNRKGYEASFYLKQGYYNYLYAYVEDGSFVADIPFFEGNHWETSNDYYIYVYNRETGDKHDRLIALEKVSIGF
ncbi:MAG: DUF5103 domain-containing protein [Bacteroidales bacterium]|nr:DUF5103 domain-containing protein [Bacteroidales bacterium]